MRKCSFLCASVCDVRFLSDIPEIPTAKLIELRHLIADVTCQEEIVTWLHSPGEAHEEKGIDAEDASHLGRNDLGRLACI